MSEPQSTPTLNSTSYPKTYHVTLSDLMRTRAEIRLSGSKIPIYTCNFSYLFGSSKKHSIVLQRGLEDSSTNQTSPILGVVQLELSSLSRPIHLCLGNPDANPQSTVWETLTVTEKLKTNGFVLDIDLGGDLGRRKFSWKRTTDVSKSFISKKFDMMHLKMVDIESGDVVAKFSHHGLMGWTRGDFIIEQFHGGERWEEVVLLSGMGVIEYVRKASGISW